MPDQPDLITQVITTPATTPDSVMGPAIQQDLAARDLLPRHPRARQRLCGCRPPGHRPDASIRSMWLARRLGPIAGNGRTGQGYDLQAFVIDWEAQQARCAQGASQCHGHPGRDLSGDPVIRIRFDRATCRACPVRRACTSAQGAPRQLTVQTQAYHEAHPGLAPTAGDRGVQSTVYPEGGWRKQPLARQPAL